MSFESFNDIVPVYLPRFTVHCSLHIPILIPAIQRHGQSLKILSSFCILHMLLLSILNILSLELLCATILTIIFTLYHNHYLFWLLPMFIKGGGGALPSSLYISNRELPISCTKQISAILTGSYLHYEATEAIDLWK